jgi:hypothetical protein
VVALSDQQEKTFNQQTNDSLTTRHLERSGEALNKSLTTAHIQQRVENVNSVQSQNNSNSSTSGTEAGQQQGTGKQ